MKVICVKNTKRLVKGVVYDAIKLENSNKNNIKPFKGTIIIKINNKNCRFVVSNFKTESGEEIPKIDWTSNQFLNDILENRQTLIDKNLKKGDYVVYKRNSHKTLMFGAKYKVIDVNIKEYKNTWRNWEDIQIKIEGSNKFYSPHSFRKCTTQEARDIHLKSILEEETGVDNPLSKGTRKIDQYDTILKEKMLIKILFSAYLDPNRNNMSVLDWACNKIAPNLSVKPDDFETIINNNIKTILEK
jgi:hypothetical protein